MMLSNGQRKKRPVGTCLRTMTGPPVDTMVSDNHRTMSNSESESTVDAKATTTSDRVIELEERISDLEAAVKAMEAYVGHIERVDEELERRADAALAAVDRLEHRVDKLDEPQPSTDSEAQSQPDAERASTEHTETSDSTASSQPPDDTQSAVSGHSIIDDESGLIERLRGQL